MGQCRVVSAGLVLRLAGMGPRNTSTSTTTSTRGEQHPQPGPAPTSTIWASTASPRDRAEPAADAPQRVMRAPPYQTWNGVAPHPRDASAGLLLRRSPEAEGRGSAPPVAGLKKPRESDSGTATAWRGKYVTSGGGTPRLIEFPEGIGLLPGDGQVAPPRGGRSRPTGVSTEPRRRETPTHDRAKLKTAAPPGSRATRSPATSG